MGLRDVRVCLLMRNELLRLVFFVECVVVHDQYGANRHDVPDQRQRIEQVVDGQLIVERLMTTYADVLPVT